MREQLCWHPVGLLGSSPFSMTAKTGIDIPMKASKVQMHAKWLYLRPSSWEQQYFAQLEGLDLLNCLITPIFFASTLSRWPRSFLSSVYCMVLAIKGYQMALLLLPAARQNKAHMKARYWIILSERILRQFVATPALGRGPRFVQWMQDTAATDPGPVTAFKLAMLVSGVTHAFWNAFCLPLDIISQVVINVIFFVIHFPATVTQVAYPVGMLVRHKPRLVWLQWGLEKAASTAAWPLQLIMQSLAAAAASILTGSRGSAHSWQPQQQQAQQACADMFALVAQPPGRAPDLDTAAGRLVLALSMTVMLFIVLYVPLLFAWRLERHLKARFMVTVMQNARTSSGGSSPIASSSAGGSSSSKAGLSPGCASKCGGADRSSGDSGSSTTCSSHISPGPSFPLFPTVKGALMTHLGAAAGVCFLLGELFVWLCTVSPAVAGILWQQIPYPAG